MKNILDHVAKSHDYGYFRPQTPEGFLGLRLAQKLDDPSAARHYAELAEQHSEGRLLTAYSRSLKSSDSGDLSRRFHTELERLGQRDCVHTVNGRLCAIRVDRRAIAIAILSGTR